LAKAFPGLAESKFNVAVCVGEDRCLWHLQTQLQGQRQSRARLQESYPTGSHPWPGLSRSVVFKDGWHGGNGLVDLGYKKHYRVDHGKNEFARGKAHITGIKSTWCRGSGFTDSKGPGLVKTGYP